jgi:hypothetical protein
MSTNARRAPGRLARRPGATWPGWLVVVGLALAGGLVLRLVVTRTPLWLDEAQSVAIARLPLSEIPGALRQDGHPPLYYALLHGWILLWGQGDAAVRSLSVVFGVATLGPLAVLARRVAGPAAGGAALALGATSPFLVRYATEARMYALLTLLAVLWALAVDRALRRPTLGALALVAGVVGALVLTHYWALFLLAAGCALVAGLALRPGPGSVAARWVLAAHAAGGLALVPWLASLAVQLRYTGTPWGSAPNPVSAVVFGFADLAGGWLRSPSLALFAGMVMLVVLGATGRPTQPGRVELDPATVPEVRPLLGLVGLTVGLGLAAGTVADSAFASRYLAVVAGFVVVVAARGAAQFGRRAVGTAVLAATAGLGLVASWHQVDEDRSQGAEVAAVVGDRGRPGDLVVACPDQLGPAVDRYLPAGVRAVGYPLLGPAERVDWTDYAERNAAADPAADADRIVELAGGGELWLVWHGGYRTYEGLCEALRLALAERLGAPTEVVVARPRVFEPMFLTRFGS